MASLNEKLLSVMECPVCYDLIRPRFYLCENGHGLCNKCLPKVHQKKCPTCRGTMLKNHNPLLEEVFNELQVPCKNKQNGCDFVGNSEKMSRHNCSFETEKCPLSMEGCSWEGVKSAVISHFVEDHVIEYEVSSVPCPRSVQGCTWSGPLSMFAKHIIENHTSTPADV